MKLTNYNIYTYANALAKAFDNNDQKLPVKVSFYLTKNKNLLLQLAQEIDQNRNNIIKKYGKTSEIDENQYQIPKEDIEKAQQEIEDLFNLEQEVQIYMISLNSFNENDTLTPAQMEALMFMMED